MKVVPVDQKAKTKEKMKNYSKIDQYLAFGIYTFVYCLGLNPYKINKETGEVSFRWFSWETIWSLIRLVTFNSPFSFLPVLLAGLFGRDEWEAEELGGLTNVTDVTEKTATVYVGVTTVEYISTYSFFVLSRAAKKFGCPQYFVWTTE